VEKSPTNDNSLELTVDQSHNTPQGRTNRHIDNTMAKARPSRENRRSRGNHNTKSNKARRNWEQLEGVRIQHHIQRTDEILAKIERTIKNKTHKDIYPPPHKNGHIPLDKSKDDQDDQEAKKYPMESGKLDEDQSYPSNKSHRGLGASGRKAQKKHRKDKLKANRPEHRSAQQR
jgi:hypothetical protein